MIIKVGDVVSMRERAAGPVVQATVTRLTTTEDGFNRAVYYTIEGVEHRDTASTFKVMMDWAAITLDHKEMDI